jgi:adenosylcobyric acid synthase
MIQEKTGRPVLGVIPYLGDMRLHEEDGIPLDRIEQFKRFNPCKPVKIVVVRLRYIANFTDFDPFLYEQDVELNYSLRDGDLENADLVIIPGSKNTVQDLLFLRESGIEASIKRAAAKGVPVIGICGGYQMLGRKIFDPYGIEGPHQEVNGLGLLDVETFFDRIKTTCQLEAEISSASGIMGKGVVKDETKLRGYEIHMGRTIGDVGLFHIKRRGSGSELIPDGSVKGNVWGTYIHGIFDNDSLRRGLINALRVKRGLAPLKDVADFAKARDVALDKWSDVLRKSIDMRFIQQLIK